MDEDAAEFEPIDADLNEAPLLEEELANTSAGSEETTTQTEKVRLVSGEVASKATVQMAEILRKEITEEKEVIFTNVLRNQLNTSSENITRREASKGFFDILSLATEGCIDLNQEETFGSIMIDAKPPLFERFITA